MIRRDQNGNNHHQRYDDNWDGQERRQVIQYETPPHHEEPKSVNWLPYVGQIVGLLVGLVTIYINLHEEQLKQSINMATFYEKYKEDTDRHNKTHADIYEKVEQVTLQTQSLEDTVTQLYRKK